MGIAKVSGAAHANIDEVSDLAKANIAEISDAAANFVTYPARTGMHNVGNEGGDPIQIGYSVVVYDSAADRLVWAFEKQSTVNAGTNNKGYILTSPVFIIQMIGEEVQFQTPLMYTNLLQLVN